jgi:hypothetical protein
MMPSKRDAHRPEKFDIGLEKMAVAVDGLRAEENLQVARQVADDKQKHDKPVPAMRYFLPSEEQNRLRKKLIINMLFPYSIHSVNLMIPPRISQLAKSGIRRLG